MTGLRELPPCRGLAMEVTRLKSPAFTRADRRDSGTDPAANRLNHESGRKQVEESLQQFKSSLEQVEADLQQPAKS